MKKQTRIPRSRCTSRRTGAARHSAAVQAARERRHPRGIPPLAPLGDPPWYRLRAGTGLTAQFRRLAGQRLVQLALGRALHDPAHLGQQVSPATGEPAQRSHRGGLFIRGQLAPLRVMFRLARDLADENPACLRTLTDHAF